jgi:DNA repair exonuclease SbcCD ATPase subunit
MEILSANFQNLLTLGHAELELSNRGLLLVQGVNLSDTSATSNGAGKSSIVDGACWTIYGTTARGVTGDAIVNNKAKKDCVGEVKLLDGTVTYRITRHRKHNTHKNQTFVHRFDDATGDWVDLSKGTDKETQAVIDTIMGCSLEVFQAAIYVGQEQMVDLPGLTDKQLKVLIEEAAGVQELQAAYTLARSEMTVAQTSLNGKVAAVTDATRRLESLGRDLESAELTIKTFEDERKPRAAKEMAEVPALKETVEKLTAALTAIDEPALTAEAATIAAQLADHAKLAGELERLRKVAHDAQSALTLTQHAETRAKTALRNAIAEFKDVDKLVGTACHECGKVYSEADLEDAKKLREKAAVSMKQPALDAVAAVKTAEGALQKAVEERDAYAASLPSVSAIAARQSAINAELRNAVSYKRQIERANDRINQCKVNAAGKLKEVNPYIAAVETLKRQIEKVETDMVMAKQAVADAETALEVANNVVKVFGPAGVRALILDTVTPYLNDRTSEYLAALSDGNIRAVWTTLAKTAKGEAKEKFNIEVTNDNGAESFVGLSGGEKRKVRLAAALALQDMVASRASKPINLFAADEIDDSLDEAGLERLMGVLERKARERGTVLVISHNSLSDWIDNVITVEKKGKVSTVSGATTTRVS